MQSIKESILTGKWRSFKTFKSTGDLRLHSEKRFREIEFTPERTLTILEHKEFKVEKIVHTNQWDLVFKNKRHYLHIAQPKQDFEVITVNHTVLVLEDNAAREKTFFARDGFWEDYLQSNHELVI